MKRHIVLRNFLVSLYIHAHLQDWESTAWQPLEINTFSMSCRQQQRSADFHTHTVKSEPTFYLMLIRCVQQMHMRICLDLRLAVAPIGTPARFCGASKGYACSNG